MLLNGHLAGSVAAWGRGATGEILDIFVSFDRPLPV
jgi:hypothetical protein